MIRQVPLTGGEKENLHASLARHRDAVLRKLGGPDDGALRRVMLPSGNTLLGLVKHLAAWEYGWSCLTFGRPTEPLPFDKDDEAADGRVGPDENTRRHSGLLPPGTDCLRLGDQRDGP